MGKCGCGPFKIHKKKVFALLRVILKHSVALCTAARYGANIRKTLLESCRWGTTMLLEEL